MINVKLNKIDAWNCTGITKEEGEERERKNKAYLGKETRYR